MRHLRPAVAAALLLAKGAAAGTCQFDSWGWLPESVTLDGAYTPAVCENKSRFLAYWNLLSLGEAGNWVKSPTCNPNNMKARLMNAVHLMGLVQNNRKTTSPKFPQYNFQSEVLGPGSPDGYVSSCTYDKDSVVYATNPSSGPTVLRYAFYFKKGVAARASTLVHEAIHEWEGHLGDHLCPAGASCDGTYKDFNAQTFQILFDSYAVGTYVRDGDSPTPRVVKLEQDVCGFQPMLSAFERQQTVNEMNWKLGNHFVVKTKPSSYPLEAGLLGPDSFWDDELGMHYAADETRAARWPCGQVCKVADYKPGGKAFCNLAYQPGNAAVNQHNLAACNLATSAIDQGVTPAQHAALAWKLKVTLKGCIPGYSESYLSQYCAAVSVGKATPAEVTAAWKLPDQPGAFDSGKALAACLRTFCQGKFDPAWVNPARAACYAFDDPVGCLPAVCGDRAALAKKHGAQSVPLFNALQCRRNFLEYGGQAGAYFSDPHLEPCEDVYERCVNESEHAAWLAASAGGTCGFSIPSGAVSIGYQRLALEDLAVTSFPLWLRAHPGAKPTGCMAAYATCKSIHRVVSERVVEVVKFGPLPDPRYSLDHSATQPSSDALLTSTHRGVLELAQIATSPRTADGMSPDQARARLTEAPEARHALASLLGPRNFFAAYGTAGLEATFGAAELARHADATLEAPEDLTLAQQQAFDALAALQPTRVRAQSAATRKLFADAEAKLAPDVVFGFAQQLSAATTASELETALDQLQRRVDATP